METNKKEKIEAKIKMNQFDQELKVKEKESNINVWNTIFRIGPWFFGLHTGNIIFRRAPWVTSHIYYR